MNRNFVAPLISKPIQYLTNRSDTYQAAAQCELPPPFSSTPRHLRFFLAFLAVYAALYLSIHLRITRSNARHAQVYKQHRADFLHFQSLLHDAKARVGAAQQQVRAAEDRTARQKLEVEVERMKVGVLGVKLVAMQVSEEMSRMLMGVEMVMLKGEMVMLKGKMAMLKRENEQLKTLLAQYLEFGGLLVSDARRCVVLTGASRQSSAYFTAYESAEYLHSSLDRGL